MEQLGAALADGNVEQASSMALALVGLGYATAIYRDSDTVLAPAIVAALVAADVSMFEYGGGLNTEQAIFSTASGALVQELLVYARAERGDDAVDNNIDIKIPDLDIAMIRGDFADWEFFTEMDGTQLREAISEVAGRKTWFRSEERRVGKEGVSRGRYRG